MSTRKGKVVLLDATLNASRDAILQKMLEDTKGKLAEIKDTFGMEPIDLSDLIALSALVVQDLSAKRIKDYEVLRSLQLEAS
jgi:arginyl-tRNA synthetase